MDGKITIHINNLTSGVTIKEIGNFIKDVLEKGKEGSEEIIVEAETISGD